MCRTGVWDERSDSEVRRLTERTQTTLRGALYTICVGSRRSPWWNIKTRSALSRKTFSIKITSHNQTNQKSPPRQMKTIRRQIRQQPRCQEKRQPRPQYFKKITTRKTQFRGATPMLAARNRRNRGLGPVWDPDISRQRNQAPGLIFQIILWTSETCLIIKCQSTVTTIH